MKAMMSKGSIFLSCLIPILLSVSSCGDDDVDEPPDVLSIWEVEYDYMVGTEDYDLFPNV